MRVDFTLREMQLQIVGTRCATAAAGDEEEAGGDAVMSEGERAVTRRDESSNSSTNLQLQLGHYLTSSVGRQ